MNMTPRFKTQDFNLACILAALGFSCDLEKIGYKKFNFVFEDDSNLQDAINRCWMKKLMLDPYELINSQSLLRTRIYSKI